MSQSSRRDYLQRIYSRYRGAARGEKRRILDEFCVNCGYHRKHAIRLLNGSPPPARPSKRRRKGKLSYGPRITSILKETWEAADYPWSVRLKALLAEWMPQIRARYRLTAALERQLLEISPRTIDHRLRGRSGSGGEGSTAGPSREAC